MLDVKFIIFILFYLVLFYFIHETSCKHRCYGCEVIHVTFYLVLSSWMENRCCDVQILVKALSNVLYMSLQMFYLTPLYSPLHSVLPHLNQYIILLCFVIVSLSFGNIRRSFKALSTLTCT